MNETTRRKISEALKERGRLSRNLNRLLTEVLEQQSDASEELLRDYEDSHIEWLWFTEKERAAETRLSKERKQANCCKAGIKRCQWWYKKNVKELESLKKRQEKLIEAQNGLENKIRECKAEAAIWEQKEAARKQAKRNRGRGSVVWEWN